jgi:hypothetical protein
MHITLTTFVKLLSTFENTQYIICTKYIHPHVRMSISLRYKAVIFERINHKSLVDGKEYNAYNINNFYKRCQGPQRLTISI